MKHYEDILHDYSSVKIKLVTERYNKDDIKETGP
jgi:hypothetical protein